MTTEWFRRSSWGPADQADFNTKLGRARPDRRSQYLRIQAVHLAEAGRDRDALPLLDRLIAEYPDQMQLAQVHKQRGDCLLRLGSPDAALDAYWAAIEAQRAFPNVRTSAPLHYGFTVARLERRELFERALSVLDEFAVKDGSIVFPKEQFLQSTARALIADARSQPEASDLATRALQAAAATHSGIVRHPTVGLVDHIAGPVLDRLRRVAAS